MRALPLALLLLAAASANGQGRLAFDDEVIDLGRIVEGEAATHTFRFTNASSGPVRIARVDVSCGCTTPSFTRRPIGPGESGEVEVAYDSNGRPGPFEKAVYVVPEGGVLSGVTLRVSGLVVPAFAARGVAIGALTFDADRVDVGAILPTAPLQVPVRFVNTSDRPVQIVGVDAPAGVEVAYPPRRVFGGSVAGLFVMVDDPAALADADGRLSIDLVLQTTDAGSPAKRVQIVGTVVSAPSAAGGE